MPSPRKQFTLDGHAFTQARDRRWVSTTTTRTYSRRQGELLAGTPLASDRARLEHQHRKTGETVYQTGRPGGRPLTDIAPLIGMLRMMQRRGVGIVVITAYGEWAEYPAVGPRWVSRRITTDEALRRAESEYYATVFFDRFFSHESGPPIGLIGPVTSYGVIPSP